MLITLYQLRHGRFLPVKEYYNWRVQLADELEDVPIHGRAAKGQTTKIPCPGCGKTLARAAIRYEHYCDGELMDYRANNLRYLRNRRWAPHKGEPDPEGCPVPNGAEIRAIYNADTNASARSRKRTTGDSTTSVDDTEIRDYTSGVDMITTGFH